MYFIVVIVTPVTEKKIILNKINFINITESNSVLYISELKQMKNTQQKIKLGQRSKVKITRPNNAYTLGLNAQYLPNGKAYELH